MLQLLNLFSGSALSRFSLFALGIMPYVTASIIFQVMAVVVPSLERLQKEGEAGYAKITQYTRYLTVALAAAQATGYAFLFKSQAAQALPNANAGRMLIIILTLTGGTTLLMWMGEQITKRGIGNGISIIIFASILAYAPSGISGWINGGTTARLFFPIIALGDRRRRRLRAWRASGGSRSSTRGASSATGRRRAARPTCRCSVNMAGVIPVIFAAAILALPQTVGSFKVPAWSNWLQVNFSPTSWKYLLLEAILIILMTYFYTSVVVQPGRPGRQPAQVQRLHPRHPAGAADGGLLRPRAEPAHLPGRALPRGRRRGAVASSSRTSTSRRRPTAPSAAPRS